MIVPRDILAVLIGLALGGALILLLQHIYL
jgi:hypothetical protein